MNDRKVVIIGAGLGGLFCAAILSKEGWPVCVLEKHYRAGGGLHTFVRNGFTFDTGMHCLAGFEEGGVLQKLCHYLGVFNKLSFAPYDSDAFDTLYIGSDGARYRFPIGEEAFMAQMIHYFPHQQKQIEKYMSDLASITDPVDMLRLCYNEQAVTYERGLGLESLGHFMEQRFSDSKIIGTLLWNSGLYGGDLDYTPTYLLAVISRIFIKGATRFSNGAQPLADALVEEIRKNGGEVRLKAEVCTVEVGDHKAVTGVRLVSGERIGGTHFISTVHPALSLSWFPQGVFSKAFTNRINEQKHTDSTFYLFIILKPERFPFLNSNLFYANDYKDICKPPLWEESGPSTLMAFTAPSGKEGAFARTLKISSPISFDGFRQWQGTLPGQRGDEYEAYKQKYIQMLLAGALKVFPNLPEAIDTLFAASPITYQYYTGSVDGSNYGFSKDYRSLHFSRLLPRTKLGNFFFSGQNLNMHGIVGVPISAVITCGELIGLKYLLEKINGNRL